MAESPKRLYQSGSEAEDTAQRIESLSQACARVLREKLGRKVASKSIASSRPDRQVVPSQSEKREWWTQHEVARNVTFRCHRSVRRWDSKLCVVKWQSWSRDGSRELAWIARARRVRTSWAQQLELSSFSRSGGPRRMINGSEIGSLCS